MLPMKGSCYPAGQCIHDTRIGCVPGREITWAREPRETSGPVMLTIAPRALREDLPLPLCHD